MGRRPGVGWDEDLRVPPPPRMASFHIPRPRSRARDCVAVDGAVGGDPALGRATGGLRLSAEDAPVLATAAAAITSAGAQPGTATEPPRSGADPGPYPAVRLAPWTGSQTEQGLQQVLQLLKDSLQSPNTATQRIVQDVSFLPGLGGPGQTSISRRGRGRISSSQTLSAEAGANFGKQLRIRILGSLSQQRGRHFCWCLALGS